MRLSGTTVLLVEDDLDNLELLALCLEGDGAEVLAAGSIAAALTASASRRIDIVVSDLELPDGDGYGLLRQLRSREGCRGLPAIAVSGYSQDQWRSRATTSGFNRYAVKPFAIEALISAIVSLKGAAADDESAAI
jgi:two-component system, OmpR family, response regulator